MYNEIETVHSLHRAPLSDAVWVSETSAVASSDRGEWLELGYVRGSESSGEPLPAHVAVSHRNSYQLEGSSVLSLKSLAVPGSDVLAGALNTDGRLHLLRAAALGAPDAASAVHEAPERACRDVGATHVPLSREAEPPTAPCLADSKLGFPVCIAPLAGRAGDSASKLMVGYSRGGISLCSVHTTGDLDADRSWAKAVSASLVEPGPSTLPAVSGLESSACGRSLAAVDAGGYLRIIDCECGSTVWRGRVLPSACASGCVHWSPDGRVLAVGGTSGELRLVDASGRAPPAAGGVIAGKLTADREQSSCGSTVCTLAGHRDAVSSVQVLGDGVRVLSAGLDGQAIIWDARRRDALHVFRAAGGPEERGIEGAEGGAASVSGGGGGTMASSASSTPCHSFRSTPAGTVGLVARVDGSITACSLQ